MTSTQARVFASATGLSADNNEKGDSKCKSAYASSKHSGAKPEMNSATKIKDASGLSADTIELYRAAVLSVALIVTVVAVIYVGLLVHQQHKIEKQRALASYSALVLRDSSTGRMCAQCDTSTGDIRIAAGTIFLGTSGAEVMPDSYTDSCMSCAGDTGSIYGLTTHNGVPLVQDDYVPLTTNGKSIYNYGHTMQAANGVAEDGGLPRSPYQIRASEFNVRTGIVHFERFTMGQECIGATCNTAYEALTNAPTAGRTMGFPDLCSATTIIPLNSVYLVHRDMDAATEFVGGVTTLGDTTDGNALTFSHICTCITPPSTNTRVQFCTGPLIGAVGGDLNTSGFQVV